MFYTIDFTQFSTPHLRDENQDRCFCLHYDGTPEGAPMSILCVLDGVSHSNGGIAAPMAMQTMQPTLAGLLGKAHALIKEDEYTREKIILGAMKSAICDAHQLLQAQAYIDASYGTTVTLVTLYDEKIYAANVGDSPAYLLEFSPFGGAPEMTSLFQCQNKAGEAVREGRMTPDEARASKWRNYLTGMVGSTEFLPSNIYTTSTWLGQNNLLLLGSDGALSVLSEQELVQLIDRELPKGLASAVQALFQRIQDSDSTDNFTVLAQRVSTV